jgi:hypothetical protein
MGRTGGGRKSGENGDATGFGLEKTNPKSRSTGVLRALKNLFHRPALRFGLARDRRHGRLRDPRFVSFVAQSNRKSLNTDLRDVVLRSQVLFRKVLIAAAILGVAWVALESAKALSVF